MPRLKRSEAELAAANGPDYVEALARGIRVLEAFDAGDRRLTLSDVARKTGLARATARRTLFTLCRLGYVESEQKLFRVTPEVLRLANAYLTSNGLTAVLQQASEAVTAALGQAASAAVLRGSDVVFIARARPETILSVGLEIGYRLPAFCTSVGRAMLAGLDEAALDAFLGRTALEPLTERTVTDPALVKAAVLGACMQGYALVDEEAELGFRSIAVPVVRPDGRTVAALNVGAPVERVTIGKMIDEVLPVLRAAAEKAGRLVV